MSIQNSVSSIEYGKLWDEVLSQETDHYVPEKYQLGIIAEFLSQQDIPFITEGRVFCYPIDVLALQNGSTISIEMKSKNVGRGIEQAHRNTDFVDYSFLSVWDEDISDELLEQVSELPIGLMGIGDSVEIYSLPTQTGQQLCSSERVVELIESHVRSHNSI